MSEMFDMHTNGAVAFSDNKNSIQDAGLMSRAILYAKGFDGLVMNFPSDKNLTNNGLVNESVLTNRIGLKLFSKNSCTFVFSCFLLKANVQEYVADDRRESDIILNVMESISLECYS